MSHPHNKLTANEDVGGVTLTKGRDPSGTHRIQKALVREIQRRLRTLRGLIRRTVGYQNDALVLKEDATAPSLQTNDHDPPEVYDFPTVQDRVREFMRDLRAWLREELLELATPIEAQNGEHFTAEFLENAYVTGVQKAQGRLMQEGVSLTADDREAILSRPIAVQQLRDIYTRAFENLQDITEDIARRLREELTTAIRDGENPRKVADRLNKELEDIERTRLVTLARTEIIKSHSDASLNTYERAGADVVTHTSRLTAKDARVCPFCRALDEVPFTLREFRNVTVRWGNQIMRVGIPAHPNGRCSPMPEMGLDGDGLPPLSERIPNTIRGKPVTILSQ